MSGVIFTVIHFVLLTFQGSCSDQDDLQLGAEANDVGKKHKTRKRPSSLSQRCVICNNYVSITLFCLVNPCFEKRLGVLRFR